MRINKKRISGVKTLNHIILIVFCIVAFFPILWIVSSSFKDVEEVIKIPPTIFPENPTIIKFVEIWTNSPFGSYMLNSLITSLLAAITTLIICLFAAYGLARFDFPGAKIILILFLLSQMFAGSSILIPVTQIIIKLGLYNTRSGLSMVYTSFFIPFSTWLLYGYFKTIPKELEEAAFIDGCSRMRSFIRIILPLSIPGLGATFIFSFLGAWNELLFALVLTNTDDVRTMSTGIAYFVGRYFTDWGKLAASSLVFSIPPLILFFILDKSMIKGLTAGSMKG